ncbi:cytochrome-c peroxidase [Christiangramia portivictoriae]|uniref:cytochrome-c peroxidase n=1 Tax=Christiangramia portivictoriae TaxID=326069 RepID=UPI001FE11515|nr:cytochrome c peroxidase [Christiangramia portivictoriae]
MDGNNLKLAGFLFSILTSFLFFSCKEDNKYSHIPKEKSGLKEVQWEETKQLYLTSLQEANDLLEQLENYDPGAPQSKEIFGNLRKAWKIAEPFAAYLNPEVGHRINGPALPVFIEDNQRVLPPIGLQKIEESIFLGDTSKEDYLKEVQVTRGMMNILLDQMQNRKLTPDRFFISVHQQLLRIISFSISGFDTPVTSMGLTEAIISLESLEAVYNSSIRQIITKNNKKLDDDFLESIWEANKFLDSDDFQNFNRYTFIREYFNPLMSHWVRIIKETGWNGDSNLVFNFKSPTFFEDDSFNTKFFSPPVNKKYSTEQIELGKELFYDRNLSQDKSMSCATCHIPENAFADRVQFNLNNKEEKLSRNTPTLINSIYQKAFFWDGRSNSILDQVSAVFSNKDEFNIGVHQFSDEILNDSIYKTKMSQILQGSKGTSKDLVKAISAYVSTLNSFNSKFDQNIRKEKNTYTKTEINGFNLYMGKAMCATCHFLPLTNGTLPPFYKISEREVLGVPKSARENKLDDDLGFYWKYQVEIHLGAFKTPTLRNISETAPYMHNGVYKTLEEVVDFYNKGGGRGLGFQVPNQTLPSDELKLTQSEMSDLISFMKTLKDLEIK